MAKLLFSFDKPEDSPGFLLWQTTITWQRLIKKILDPFQISHAQFVIMAITLWFDQTKQEPTQILIARQSKLDKMTVSKALKKLVSQGYVRRSEHIKDTRAKKVELTSQGKALISQAVPLIEELDKQFFKSLKENDQKTLTSLLHKLSALNLD